MKDKKQYLYWGLTAFCVICGVLIFYDTVFQNSVLFVFLRKLVNILAPVCYGLVMAYLLTPVVNAIERFIFRREEQRTGLFSRSVAIFITWLLVLLLFYMLLSVLVPQLYVSVVSLIANGERYYNTVLGWVQKFLEDNPQARVWMSQVLNTYYQELLEWLKTSVLPQAQDMVALLTSTLTTGVLSVVGFFGDLLVGIIVSIYALAMKESFAATACKMTYSFFSTYRAEQIIRGTKKVNRIFSGFFRGKLLDSLIIGIICFICSTIFKFPYAPLVSLVVGVTNIIPFFGPFLGAIPCAFIILLDSPIKCLYFVIFILVLQQFDGNILGPKILGDSTGLSSFWVIVAILVAGGLWGVFGMLIGVPLFACIYTGVRRYCSWRLEEKGLPSHTRNYHTHKPLSDEQLEEIARRKAAQRSAGRKQPVQTEEKKSEFTQFDGKKYDDEE